MRLRRLEKKDAEPMLEWMHDKSVVEKLQTNFMDKTMDDCLGFIENSYSKENVHLAIVDENDNYMGTVSLKHITDTNAEFAITVCKKAMGKGYSIWGMNEIIRVGLEDMGLDSVYWCVDADNERAVRFYDKNNFPRVSVEDIVMEDAYTEEQKSNFLWYQVSK